MRLVVVAATLTTLVVLGVGVAGWVDVNPASPPTPTPSAATPASWRNPDSISLPGELVSPTSLGLPTGVLPSSPRIIAFGEQRLEGFEERFTEAIEDVAAANERVRQHPWYQLAVSR